MQIKRYKEYYDLDPYDPKNFDIIMDTTHTDKEDSINILTEEINKFIEKEKQIEKNESS